MSRRHRISFTDSVPEELADLEHIMFRYRATITSGNAPGDVDASGLGKKYRPERGDLDTRRQPVQYAIFGDDDFERYSHALSILHHKAIAQCWVLHVHYGIKPGNPYALCRTMRILPEHWCDYRNTALRMLEEILSGDVDKEWKTIYSVRTCERIAEDALAD